MNILVTFKTFGNQKNYLKTIFKDSAAVFFAEDYREEDLGDVFAKSDILLSWNPSAEGIDKNRVSLSNIKFVQLMSAGYDHVRLDDFVFDYRTVFCKRFRIFTGRIIRTGGEFSVAPAFNDHFRAAFFADYVGFLCSNFN